MVNGVGQEAGILLGDCYADGRVVGTDLAEAMKWFRKAAAQGDSDAIEALSRIA